MDIKLFSMGNKRGSSFHTSSLGQKRFLPAVVLVLPDGPPPVPTVDVLRMADGGHFEFCKVQRGFLLGFSSIFHECSCLKIRPLN